MSEHASAGGAAINLLQITDSHLMKDANGELLGVVTRESFQAVLRQIESDIAEGRCPKPDYILATGDITQDASKEAYQYFLHEVARFNCPVRWFPGNHDDSHTMAQVANGDERKSVLKAANWQIIALDSSVAGSVHGRLDRSELDALDKALNSEPDLSTLVSFHHHPVDISSTWLDRIGLHNRDELFSVIDRFKNVKAILWGHIHQDYESERQGVQLFASPSTCIQFTPKSDDFAVEAIAPGYRWMSLYDDGRIETQVVRAESYEFNLDMESNGY